MYAHCWWFASTESFLSLLFVNFLVFHLKFARRTNFMWKRRFATFVYLHSHYSPQQREGYLSQRCCPLFTFKLRFDSNFHCHFHHHLISSKSIATVAKFHGISLRISKTSLLFGIRRNRNVSFERNQIQASSAPGPTEFGFNLLKLFSLYLSVKRKSCLSRWIQHFWKLFVTNENALRKSVAQCDPITSCDNVVVCAKRVLQSFVASVCWFSCTLNSLASEILKLNWLVLFFFVKFANISRN